MKARLGIFLAALWWGSLTSLGFLVVPLLFVHLSSPMIAGSLAAKLFTAQTWLSVGCAMLLLTSLNKKEPRAASSRPRPAIEFVVAGLFLAVLLEFGVSPHILDVRSAGGNLRLWHGIGSAMYLLQWVCASMVLWRLSADTRVS